MNMNRNERLKAVVCGVNLRNHDDDFASDMQELKRLAEACELEVVGEVTQSLDRVHPSHYIGLGKIQELTGLIEGTGADLVVFNDELTPSQIRELEKQLDRRVMDRTMLILDIFASRAKTREAKLQVEMAQLQYMLPRLAGRREHLSRQGGGAGLRNRGAGETKLEMDRRKIEIKIAALTKELDALAARREVQRKKRQKNEIPVVSLVGYTNAGKSTIMNAMVEQFHPSPNKQVFEKDMLFATLDTSVRKVKLPDNKTFLLTDTVGFVNKLPHHLVKAFRSTLEEAANADLLIHVVDFSDPRHPQLMEVTRQTLEEIGVRNVPVIVAFNKSDLADTEIPRVDGDAVYLSAKQRIGIRELAGLIASRIFKDYMQCELLIPYDQGRILAYLNEHGNVLSTEYEPDGTRIWVECRHSDFEKYRDYVVAHESV